MHAGYLQWRDKKKEEKGRGGPRARRGKLCPTFLTGRWRYARRYPPLSTTTTSLHPSLRPPPSSPLFVRFFPSVLHLLWSVHEDNVKERGIAVRVRGLDFDAPIKPATAATGGSRRGRRFDVYTVAPVIRKCRGGFYLARALGVSRVLLPSARTRISRAYLHYLYDK